MNWVIRAMIGPTLWAVAFACIYALHGVGCAKEWFAIPVLWGNLHQLVLISAFVVALVLAYGLFRMARNREGVKALVIKTGDWIGLAGTLLTLFPVLGLTTCF